MLLQMKYCYLFIQNVLMFVKELYNNVHLLLNLLFQVITKFSLISFESKVQAYDDNQIIWEVCALQLALKLLQN